MDHHLLAAISIAGTSLDLLGGMYLAYDLLGGKHGPLRTLTRGVTYAAIFATMYGIPLGWKFGVAVGVTTGFTLAFELSRVAREEPEYSLAVDAVFSLIRGVGFGIGLFPDFGLRFAEIFAGFSTAGQIFAYWIGFKPTMEYQQESRPRMTRKKALAALNRTAGYVITSLVCGAISQRTLFVGFALKVGLSIGIATAVATFLMPWIEWVAENLPERRLGVFGIGLILSGFSLQSVQYWVALLDIPVR